MRKIFNFLLLLFLLAASCQPGIDMGSEAFRQAGKNAELAHESCVRSLNFTRAWMAYRDSSSGLIPSNLTGKIDLWEPHNAAADNYAFMVLTSFLLDQELYEGPMLDMLNAERELTSRVGSMPDTWSFSKQDFHMEEVDMDWIIFGTSEYIKDGILPITEYIGNSPWLDRMLEMLDDVGEHYSVLRGLDQLGNYRAAMEEVNGEMLQILSRVYWLTGDQKYLDRAIEIGDFYLLGERDLSGVEYLRLRDHGCEVISGLSELYVALHFADPDKKDLYQEGIYRLFDRILETGRNEDGLFYNAINPATGEVVDSGVADTWGYSFNAYYAIYLVDGKDEYRQAFLDCIENLNNKYRNYPWERESHDGYADAIESGINLYNREPVPALGEWIDSEIRVMWGKQREDGIVEGWHGDGNFARTAIMHALSKTNGVFCSPWREDLKIGTSMSGDELFLVVSSANDYTGKLTFDRPRHRDWLNLPMDYPRINQFPEWFTADKDKSYQLASNDPGLHGGFSGEDLLAGLPLEIKAGQKVYIILK